MVELQVTQLDIEQLKGHKLLLRVWPETHEEQVLVELQTAQFTTEQL
jgi:hypothetical protein